MKNKTNAVEEYYGTFSPDQFIEIEPADLSGAYNVYHVIDQPGTGLQHNQLNDAPLSFSAAQAEAQIYEAFVMGQQAGDSDFGDANDVTQD